VIGPWSHSGLWNSSPAATTGRRKHASRFDHYAEMARFLHHHLSTPNAAFASEPAVHYYTMSVEQWRSCETWPPPDSHVQPWYLHPHNGLTPGLPASDGADDYRVDFSASTGRDSRFGRHFVGRTPVRYGDRSRRDRQLLCFTSEPLADDVEITGHPIVTCYLTSTATDGAFFAYLEDVDAHETTVMITDGGIRLGFASESATEPASWEIGPTHGYNRADHRPLTPALVFRVTFDLHPTSYLVRRGHRLRLAFAGADDSNFRPVAQDQHPQLQILHGPARPSRIELPTRSL
jgi:putative CocE/NonD family hydrolase